jgi:phosphatidylserine decarboxylase
VRQIAGAMARRIVTYAKAGKQCHRNEHLGFIKLGSRVDLYLPVGTEIFVEIGESVRGNETIIGRLPETTQA